MKNILGLMVLFVLFVVIAAPAAAQSNGKFRFDGIGTNKPGDMIRPMPMPVKPTGISGGVRNYEGQPMVDVSLIVSIVRQDPATFTWFADHATARKFGSCAANVTLNCVRADGTYTISDASLPPSLDGNPDRLLDIRAEAPGYFHHIADQVRVWVTAGVLNQVQQISIYPLGINIGDPYVKWITGQIVSIGFWLSSDWEQDVDVSFEFSGSSWTKSQVDYGTTTIREQTLPGFKWVESWFWAPANDTSYYGGAFCGKLQVSASWSQEWVMGQTKQVCTPLRQSPTVNFPNNAARR